MGRVKAIINGIKIKKACKRFTYKPLRLCAHQDSNLEPTD